MPIAVVVGLFFCYTDFQYAAGDSVLLVNENDYNMCNVWNPISSWINGPHPVSAARTPLWLSWLVQEEQQDYG
jgi:hypothetical protein